MSNSYGRPKSKWYIVIESTLHQTSSSKWLSKENYIKHWCWTIIGCLSIIQITLYRAGCFFFYNFSFSTTSVDMTLSSLPLSIITLNVLPLCVTLVWKMLACTLTSPISSISSSTVSWSQFDNYGATSRFSSEACIIFFFSFVGHTTAKCSCPLHL